MSTLILKSNEDDFERYYTEGLKKENVDVCSVYKTRKKWGRYLSIVFIQYLKIPYQSWNYGEWKKHLDRYDTIIIFDRIWDFSIIEYIAKKNKKARIIFWYWNKVIKEIPDKFKKYCEVWSFDEADCKKYGFNKNIQFYIYKDTFEKEPIKQDVYFVGKEKNRGKEIVAVVKELEERGYIVKCEILTNNSEIEEKYRIIDSVPYKKAIKNVLQSRCILDIANKEQSGITLRVLESLFYKKKLITNNVCVKQLPFYNENNIFIIGEHDKNALNNFMNKTYDESVNQFMKLYTEEQWLKNFGD